MGVPELRDQIVLLDVASKRAVEVLERWASGNADSTEVHAADDGIRRARVALQYTQGVVENDVKDRAEEACNALANFVIVADHGESMGSDNVRRSHEAATDAAAVAYVDAVVKEAMDDARRSIADAFKLACAFDYIRGIIGLVRHLRQVRETWWS